MYICNFSFHCDCQIGGLTPKSLVFIRILLRELPEWDSNSSGYFLHQPFLQEENRPLWLLRLLGTARLGVTFLLGRLNIKCHTLFLPCCSLEPIHVCQSSAGLHSLSLSFSPVFCGKVRLVVGDGRHGHILQFSCLPISLKISLNRQLLHQNTRRIH